MAKAASTWPGEKLGAKRMTRSRYYLWPDDGEPLRLTMAFLEEKATLPQYAGRRMKQVSVVYDDEAIKRVTGGYVTFNSTGHWDRQAAVNSGSAQWNAYLVKWDAKRSKVADLGEVRDAADKAALERWEPSPADIDRIVADLFGEARIKIARAA
jgi:hypothetical protein